MKILFMTDKYFPKAKPNSICLQPVADYLVEQGHEVHIMGFEDSGIESSSPNPKIKTFFVKPDLRLRLRYYHENFPDNKYSRIALYTSLMLNRSKKIFTHHWTPLYSISFPLRIYKYLVKLHQNYKYDTVVSLYQQNDNCISGMWLKNRFPEVKFMIYSLDTFKVKFIKISDNTNHYWLPKYLDVCDKFIYLRSREPEYQSAYFDKWRNKMFPSDIPLLKSSKIQLSETNENDIEQWVYAGSLGAPHYIPDDFLKIFLGLNDGKKRIMHFYSPSRTYMNKLDKLYNSNDCKIQWHDFISYSELVKIQCNADVIVTMKYSDQISAKTFECMSYGKRIVHISGTKDDPDANYISNYSNGILLKPYENSIENCIKLLTDELKKPLNTNIDLSYFEMNKPEYTAQLILNLK